MDALAAALAALLPVLPYGGGKHVQDHSSNQVVRCVPIEILQGTQEVHIEEMILPWFVPNGWKSLVYGIEFGDKTAVKIMDVTGRYLAIIDEGATS